MPYAPTLDHKHLPEIQRYGDLAEVPLFVPMVGAYYRGMLVQIPCLERCCRPAGPKPCGSPSRPL